MAVARVPSRIRIKYSKTTPQITTSNRLLYPGELAYTSSEGDSAGGDRLFIGAGNLDYSSNPYAADSVHVIGGKYFTDMMDHPKGRVVPSSAIITDANNKINQLTVDDIVINGNTISTPDEDDIVLHSGTEEIDIMSSVIKNALDPTQPQDVATKNYVDNLSVIDVDGDTVVSGTGVITSGEKLQIRGSININTTLTDLVDGTRINVNLNDDLIGLSRVRVSNIDITGNEITTGIGDLTLSSTAGNVIIGGNLQVNGTTTTINSTELTVDDKNITLASGAANAAAADSAGIHVDGANADIYYDAPTDTWNFNKDVKAPNIDVEGTITVSGGITGQYSGFDSDFAAKSTTDLTEGDNLYYTQGRFDSALSEKTTDDVTEGSNLYYTTTRWDERLATKTTTNLTEGSNLYFTNERVDDRIYNLLRPGEGIDFNYNDVDNEFDISCEFASTLNAGIATFDSQDFLVTAGNVELATIDCGTF